MEGKIRGFKMIYSFDRDFMFGSIGELYIEEKFFFYGRVPEIGEKEALSKLVHGESRGPGIELMKIYVIVLGKLRS